MNFFKKKELCVKIIQEYAETIKMAQYFIFKKKLY